MGYGKSCVLENKSGNISETRKIEAKLLDRGKVDRGAAGQSGRNDYRLSGAI